MLCIISIERERERKREKGRLEREAVSEAVVWNINLVFDLFSHLINLCFI